VTLGEAIANLREMFGRVRVERDVWRRCNTYRGLMPRRGSAPRLGWRFVLSDELVQDQESVAAQWMLSGVSKQLRMYSALCRRVRMARKRRRGWA
jgi:hypothetical protein